MSPLGGGVTGSWSKNASSFSREKIVSIFFPSGLLFWNVGLQNVSCSHFLHPKSETARGPHLKHPAPQPWTRYHRITIYSIILNPHTHHTVWLLPVPHHRLHQSSYYCHSNWHNHNYKPWLDTSELRSIQFLWVGSQPSQMRRIPRNKNTKYKYKNRKQSITNQNHNSNHIGHGTNKDCGPLLGGFCIWQMCLTFDFVCICQLFGRWRADSTVYNYS